jgi:hypothetical protein
VLVPWSVAVAGAGPLSIDRKFWLGGHGFLSIMEHLTKRRPGVPHNVTRRTSIDMTHDRSLPPPAVRWCSSGARS